MLTLYAVQYSLVRNYARHVFSLKANKLRFDIAQKQNHLIMIDKTFYFHIKLCACVLQTIAHSFGKFTGIIHCYWFPIKIEMILI